MAYCTITDLYNSYGEENVNGWSRMDPLVIERAIANAGAEIDGYLLSGGYPVPLELPPANIRTYCVDIAAAKLLVGVGVLKDDPGGAAVMDQAKSARRYLEKVAGGQFRIPGYSTDGDVSRPASGNVRVSARQRIDLRGY